MKHFARASLAMDAKVPLKLQKPHITEVVTFDKHHIQFPLKAEHEKANGTLLGLRRGAELEGRGALDDEGRDGGNEIDDTLNERIAGRTTK